MILQPGDVWVIEYAVSEGESPDISAALRTCHLRGWIALEINAVPQASIGDNGELLENTQGVAPIYRLTEAGWSVIHRSQAWVISTFIVATVSLIATIVSIYLTLSGG
ncbi:MAG: hypothetical protein U0Z26_05000 [Anaerolineales bacterium]